MTVPLLQISLLGDFRLVYNGSAVTSIAQPRQQSLLTYLLLHRDIPQPRQRLAFLFWPDTSESQAHTNLRQLLFHLRRNLPDADRFLRMETKTVQWREESDYSVDIEEFEQRLAFANSQSGNPFFERAALEAAAGIYAGELLPGCYEDWILPERERLHQIYIKTLVRIAQIAEETRDYAPAIAYTEALLRLDPLLEPAHAQLIRLYRIKGDRASAIRAYHAYAKVLERELGIKPSHQIQQEYQHLLVIETHEANHFRPAPDDKPATSLVGRTKEWNKLLSTWRYVAAKQPSFTLISGEAGIGKTRLAEEFLDWAAHHEVSTAKTRSYAGEGRLPYAPVTDLLRTELFRPGISRLEAVWIDALSFLMPELRNGRSDSSKAQGITDRWKRKRLFEALARAVFPVKGPLVLLFDDLQWCDPDTIEWLHYLLHFQSDAKLLIIGTARSGDFDEKHPINPVLSDLRNRGQITEIELDHLGPGDSLMLAEQVTGKHLDVDEVSRLYAKSEGNPLFIIEMVRADRSQAEEDKAIQNAEGLARSSNIDSQPSLIQDVKAGLPMKVYSIIQTRLQQLSPVAHDLANLAATIGRAFSFDILSTASELDDETLVQGLDELWRRRIVRELDSSGYDFSHDFIREVAYKEISAAKRGLLHKKVARALEKIHSSNTGHLSSLIASHYEKAGLTSQAVDHYRRAVSAAQQTFSNAEVISLSKKGLVLLPCLPPSQERSQIELEFLISIGTAIMASKGYGHSEAEQTFLQAWEVCQNLHGASDTIPVLAGLWLCLHNRGSISQATCWAQKLESEIQNGVDESFLPIIYFALLGTALMQGNFASARQYGERGISFIKNLKHDAHILRYGYNPELTILLYLANTYWCLGFPDQARNFMLQAITYAVNSKHPGNIAIARGVELILLQLCGDIPLLRNLTERSIIFGTENETPQFTFLAYLLHGWAIGKEGQSAEGIKEQKQGIDGLRAMDAGVGMPYYVTLLAEGCTSGGQPEKGLEAIKVAMSYLKVNGESWFESEIFRQQGETFLSTGDEEAAEKYFLRALETARHQQAKSFELRAAISLSLFWHGKGKAAAAHQLLSEIYHWFTEGFDTADLRLAKDLLSSYAYDLA